MIPVNVPTLPENAEVRTFAPSRMKFNPASGALYERGAELRLTRGIESGVLDALDLVMVTSTNSLSQPEKSLIRTVGLTGLVQQADSWGSLPNIGDYVKLEELDEMEEARLAVFEARKKLGW